MSGRRVVVPLRAVVERLDDGHWRRDALRTIEANERHARRRQACLSRTRCRFALAKDRVSRWFDGLDAAMRVLHEVERGGR